MLQDLLAELASALIPLGMTPKGIGKLVRCAFVRAAGENSRLGNGKINHSRVAAQTGLSRGDVTRLLKGNILDAACADRAPLHRVIQGWHADGRFQNRNGHPRRLEISKPGSSFRALVRKYAGDIPHRAVLHELQRVGAVVIHDGSVKLRISKKNLDQRYNFWPLAEALPVLVDAIRIASSGPRHRAGTIQRLTFQKRLDVGFAAAKDRCRMAARSLQEELGLALSNEKGPKIRNSTDSVTVTVMLVNNKRRRRG
jgi:Family of unknown function (DUF6502)